MTITPSSLRNRLMLAAAILGITFATLFGAVASWRVQHAEDQAVRAALATRLELARDQVIPDGAINQDVGSPKTDLVQVIAPNGTIRASSPALLGVRRLADVASVARSPAGVDARLALQQPDIDLAIRAVPLELTGNGESPAGTGALVVAVDTEGFNTATSDLFTLLIVGLLAVVLAMAGLSWILIGRALGSVTRIAESAEKVGPKDLSAGLPVPRNDAELARLVETLNRMLLRLHVSHATELAFAADAGHRLRTPVATLRAEAELALRDHDPRAQTAALARIVEDADQLTSIVDRMLARSRAASHAPQPILAAIAAASGRWRRQADLCDITLRIHIDEQLTAQSSCLELTEVLDPIVDNAVRHTPNGGSVKVDVRLDRHEPDVLAVSISNTGAPVPADIAPHVFDPWVSSRDASVAGGLGLWLARETARDLGGEVDLADEDDFPTTFRVRMPMTPRAPSDTSGSRH